MVSQVLPAGCGRNAGSDSDDPVQPLVTTHAILQRELISTEISERFGCDMIDFVFKMMDRS